MDFSSDQKTWGINNEYLFGKSFLVTPILNPQYTPEKFITTDENQGWDKKEESKENSLSYVDFTQNKTVKVYLPAGTDWFDFWTNEKHKGGQEIDKTVNFQSIPLYVNKKGGHSIKAYLDKNNSKIIGLNQDLTWANNYTKMYPAAAARIVEKVETFVVPANQNGNFTLTVEPLDPGIVLHKIIIDNGGYEETYLKMNESPYKKINISKYEKF